MTLYRSLFLFVIICAIYRNSAVADELLLATREPIVASRPTLILSHGLNLKPEAMQPLADYFRRRGFKTAILGLKGHRKGDSWKSVSPQTWLDELSNACQSVRNARPEQKLYFLGYSVSGLLAVVYQDSQPKCSFDKMVLIAPAIWPTARTIFVRAITWLKYFGLSLPSLTPKKYRRHSSTSLAAYDSMFELVDHCRILRQPQLLGQIPTLVWLNPKDELVDFSKLRNWINASKLSSWRVLRLDPESGSLGEKHYGHLLVDRESLGESSWRYLTETSAEFFK